VEPVSCPNENEYARLLDGLASSDQRRRLEEHIDTCTDCRALLAELGKAFAPADARERRSTAPTENALPRTVLEGEVMVTHPHRQLIALELAMLAAHLVWTALTLNIAARAAFPPGTTEWAGRSVQTAPGIASLILGVVCYALIWAPLGTLWTATAAYGLWRRRPWACGAARVHALLSLPSGWLLPLGVMVLVELRRGRVH
jgi:anti-sigma factor RsiW